MVRLVISRIEGVQWGVACDWQALRLLDKPTCAVPSSFVRCHNQHMARVTADIFVFTMVRRGVPLWRAARAILGAPISGMGWANT